MPRPHFQLVERPPLYVQIADREFTERTADALAVRLAELVASGVAPGADLFMAAMHYASTGRIGADALLVAIQNRRIFG